MLASTACPHKVQQEQAPDQITGIWNKQQSQVPREDLHRAIPWGSYKKETGPRNKLNRTKEHKSKMLDVLIGLLPKVHNQAPKQSKHQNAENRKLSNTRDQLPRLYSRAPHAQSLSPYCACHLDADVSKEQGAQKGQTKTSTCNT